MDRLIIEKQRKDNSMKRTSLLRMSCGQLNSMIIDYLANLKYNLDLSYEEPCRVEDGYRTPRYIPAEKRESAEKIIKFLRWILKEYSAFINDSKGNYIDVYKLKHYLNSQLHVKAQELEAIIIQPSLLPDNGDEGKKISLELEIRRIKYFNRFLNQGFEMLEFVYK